MGDITVTRYVNARLLHVNRTDARHQLTRRRLRINLNLDETVRRHAFVLPAFLRGQQQCAERLSNPNEHPQPARL